jgi:hypothetical protein
VTTERIGRYVMEEPRSQRDATSAECRGRFITGWQGLGNQVQRCAGAPPGV